MPKIVFIGAGSLGFTRGLVRDVLTFPALADSTIRLMDTDAERLAFAEAAVGRIIKAGGYPARLEATTDRRKALDGADGVLCTILAAPVSIWRHDIEIPKKYGVDTNVGDTRGPSGVFRALRTIPVMLGICRDMEELCPDAILLNYTNPMAACCYALGRVSNVPYIGLCHGVQTTLDLISGYVDLPKEEIDYLCAGINHMGWFLKLERNGVDLYPLFKERCELPEYYVNEKVRIEVMRHFGYFMTESTGHLSEYVPWFRSSQRAMDLYCDEPGFGGESGAYYKWSAAVAQKYADTDPLQFETPVLQPRSVEYCSYILEAHATGRPFRLQGNVRNDGYIDNLPAGCCVEVPVYVDREGLHPLRVGKLPPHCAALNQSNVTVQALAVEAGLNGDPELAMQAIAMDPLTSACCTLAEIRKMTGEMLAAQAEWLPQFSGKRLRPTPTIHVPANVERAEVPLDPALAIGKRFTTLITQGTAQG